MLLLLIVVAVLFVSSRFCLFFFGFWYWWFYGLCCGCDAGAGRLVFHLFMSCLDFVLNKSSGQILVAATIRRIIFWGQFCNNRSSFLYYIIAKNSRRWTRCQGCVTSPVGVLCTAGISSQHVFCPTKRFLCQKLEAAGEKKRYYSKEPRCWRAQQKDEFKDNANLSWIRWFWAAEQNWCRKDWDERCCCTAHVKFFCKSQLTPYFGSLRNSESFLCRKNPKAHTHNSSPPPIAKKDKIYPKKTGTPRVATKLTNNSYGRPTFAKSQRTQKIDEKCCKVLQKKAKKQTKNVWAPHLLHQFDS